MKKPTNLNLYPIPTRKKIKTIAEFYNDEFDNKVNAAIADGYELTKRTVVVPHNEKETILFYAELEKDIVPGFEN